MILRCTCSQIDYCLMVTQIRDFRNIDRQLVMQPRKCVETGLIKAVFEVFKPLKMFVTRF
jgi:hypothetical protein